MDIHTTRQTCTRIYLHILRYHRRNRDEKGHHGAARHATQPIPTHKHNATTITTNYMPYNRRNRDENGHHGAARHFFFLYRLSRNVRTLLWWLRACRPRCPVSDTHTATPWNTLHHTATHCNALRRTATHCNALKHTATHCTTCV